MISNGIVRLICWGTLIILSAGCVPFDKIYSHDFRSGYFKLKTPETNRENVFINLSDDSITVYPVLRKEKAMLPDTGSYHIISIKNIKPGSYLYNSTFIKTSVDFDLTTALLKFRPALENVPSQLSANVNGLFYAGFRKDYFKLKTDFSQLNKTNSFIRHTGIDFGLIAGIGITPLNPTVTVNKINQEYDGIVFEKGVALFATYENMSVGIAFGFDNLLDHNKRSWIYNQKPWLGFVIGIANF